MLLNDICCPEGQVNQNGACQETCNANYVRNDKGICDCGDNIKKISFDDSNFICCPEGMVSQNGNCAEECVANYVKNTK